MKRHPFGWTFLLPSSNPTSLLIVTRPPLSLQSQRNLFPPLTSQAPQQRQEPPHLPPSLRKQQAFFCVVRGEPSHSLRVALCAVTKTSLSPCCALLVTTHPSPALLWALWDHFFLFLPALALLDQPPDVLSTIWPVCFSCLVLILLSASASACRVRSSVPWGLRAKTSSLSKLMSLSFDQPIVNSHA